MQGIRHGRRGGKERKRERKNQRGTLGRDRHLIKALFSCKNIKSVGNSSSSHSKIKEKNPTTRRGRKRKREEGSERMTESSGQSERSGGAVKIGKN